MLQIHLFGTPRIILNEQVIAFNAPPKTLPLLAYLLLRRGQPLPRSQVAFALWPDLPEETARANMRRHLHHLQHALPEANTNRPWLETDARQVGWNACADYWLDVNDFEACVQAGRLEEAVALYTGDLLEAYDEEWLYAERVRLNQIYNTSLTRLVNEHRSRRSFVVALKFARQLLARDPFNEEMLRQVMAIHHEAGDRPAAIQAYETFRRDLQLEMGVAPMPETRALHELVLRDTPLPGAQEIVQRGASGREPAAGHTTNTFDAGRAVLPFTGRRVEMEQLAACWQRAAPGNGGLALLSGEAGVGKSRLTQELALYVESQGGRVLAGKSSPGEPRTYQPVVEALQTVLPLAAAVALPPTLLDALAALIPEIKKHLGGHRISALPRLAPEQERTRLFSAVAGCIEGLAGVRPLLLVLDDLHWASEATLALVEFLARGAARHAILILGAYREEETPRSLRALRRSLEADGLVEHLALRNLSAADVTGLLARLDASGSLQHANRPALEEQLFSVSEGSPLFIDMLLAGWGDLEPGGQMPGSVRAAISQRLGNLPDGARAYAEVAAIAGPAFDNELVRAAGGWNEAQTLDSAGLLLKRRLIREAEGRSPFDFTFAHHLIQQALYDEIPPAKRKRRHFRVAEVLEELYADGAPEQEQVWAAQLASHFDLGGCPARAIPWYQASARLRLALFADSSALQALERAIELIRQQINPPGSLPVSEPDLRLVFELQTEREAILDRQGNRSAQLETLTQLETLARALQDDELLCCALQRSCAYHRNTTGLPAEKIVVAVLKQIPLVHTSLAWQARLAMIEGGMANIENNIEQAKPLYQQALALFEKIPDREGQMECLCRLADTGIQVRDRASTEKWTRQALALTGALDGSYHLLRLLWTVAASNLAGDDPHGCIEFAHQQLELARKLGDRLWEAHALRLIGMANRNRFQIAQARANLNAALALYVQANHTKCQGLAWQSLASVAEAVGNNEESLRMYQQALDFSVKTSDLKTQSINLINLAQVSAGSGDFHSERRYAQQALDLAHQITNPFLEAHALGNLAEAERELGELEPALAHAQQCVDLFAQTEQPFERGTALTDLALTHLALGRLDRAGDLASELLALYPQAKGKIERDHTWLWLAARVRRAAGNEQDARCILAEAYQSVQEKASLIPDPESRVAFLNKRDNAQIVAAFKQNLQS